jgi:hypothetical protein
MALAGTLVIENFGYGVSEATLPLFEDEDTPVIDEETGEQRTMDCKILTIEPASGVRVEIRVAKVEWDDFLRVLGTSLNPSQPEA